MVLVLFWSAWKSGRMASFVVESSPIAQHQLDMVLPCVSLFTSLLLFIVLFFVLSSPLFFFFQRFLYFISYIDRIPTYTILKKNKLPTPLNHRSPLLSLLPFANFSFSLSLFILSVFRSLSFSFSFTFTTTFPGLLRSTHYSPHSIHPPLPPPHFNNLSSFISRSFFIFHSFYPFPSYTLPFLPSFQPHTSQS